MLRLLLHWKVEWKEILQSEEDNFENIPESYEDFSPNFSETQPASVLRHTTISWSDFAYICWFVKLHLPDCETDKFNQPDGNLSYLLVPLTSPTISWTMRFALDKSSQGLQLKWANALRVSTLFLQRNLNSLLLFKVSVSKRDGRKGLWMYKIM